MIIKETFFCKNHEEQNYLHESTIRFIRFFEWEILDSPCVRKYGPTFAQMMGCTAPSFLSNRFTVVNAILAHEQGAEIIFKEIEQERISPILPFENILLNLQKTFIRWYPKHKEQILRIAKNPKTPEEIQKTIIKALEEINQQNPNQENIQHIFEIITQKELNRYIISSTKTIFSQYPEYALKIAKILLKENKYEILIDYLFETNIHTTPEGIEILRHIAQHGKPNYIKEYANKKLQEVEYDSRNHPSL